ncbi:tRNA U34 5-methylaminomethyl-2-thiouridine-forming methyltransferase MnmC [Muriicola jejuensis]|uniref:tRNA (5-methylaminomethyl-2-thiouridine)(34)-methyltransferase MnmD n=1 Tax=Muriicola jejuensis TaxID=504488 RepID=A0A6P0UBS2_9FLAO|nr:tRNA (5-methylaminomethyl-2-thiouridine)(34)-methyltransferase MnmD [Muriicola jejuensis]NER10695.1 tRNA (5-methylaminomethyl-2-thiouridine)(34)-methyltransferase MnmD [Muriicola jejuensis]SMP16851.1 tRNA U34 5-methylaminomethyl-2-thiouridine-forming methyltransferase MnmC [Muriicola jejuensis]
MKRTIITTADGSRTLAIEDWNEHYHSTHGAVNEAFHVFIDHGLAVCAQKEVSILEVGFGTGLNALITMHEAKKRNQSIAYTGVEAYPVSLDEVDQLNYVDELDVPHLRTAYLKMHQCPWGVEVPLTPGFTLVKQKKDFDQISDQGAFDLIYFDAFGPRVQPELWTFSIFSKMFNALRSKGVLVTYSAKGSVRRALQEVGFSVERLPGPPGKREMLRGRKSQ